MEAFLITIGAVVITSVLLYILNPTRKKINKIAGPPTLPVIGNAHQFKPNGSDFFEQCMEYYREFKDNSGILRIWVGLKPIVMLYRAETVEYLLSSTKHITKSEQYEYLHPWLKTGLLTSTGEKWKLRRRMLTPTFHFRILADFMDVFNNQSDILVSCLQSSITENNVLDIFPFITSCALDIICETAMGHSLEAQQLHNSQYVSAIYKISELINHRQRTPWYWNDTIYNTFFYGKEHDRCIKILHDFSQKVIKERQKEFYELYGQTHGESLEDFIAGDDGGKKKRLAFLDMLIHSSENGTKLSFEDIQEEVDTFMFEGHDTTAAGISWSLYLIGLHPDVQHSLHQEMDDIFGTTRRHATVDDLKQMKYLECVIKESLRLYPSVPMFARTISQECTINGFKVPSGVDVIVFTNALHRDEKYFPEPEKFDPDRFTLEKSAGRHPYSYVPFSAGQRNCIGQRFALMEEKVVLSAVLRNFKIESKCLREEIRPVAELILRPENGIHIGLVARE